MVFKHEPPRGSRPTRCDQCLVFIACCLAALVCSGTAFGLGSVYLDIMDTFSTSRPLAALPHSLCAGLGLGAGIVTGPFLGRLGGAVTLMTGGLLCCVGCIGSSLAPNIYVLIVCFGVLAGTGVSCGYLAAQVVTGTLVHQWRHVAVPVVTVSAGIGMSTFPPLLRWLVNEYTFRGMFLILAGLCFHCVLFGLVVRTFGASRDRVTKDANIEIETEEVERGGNMGQASGGGGFEGELKPLNQRSSVNVTISDDVEVLWYDWR